MANTYSQMLIQIVFAVKYRDAMIEKSFKTELFGVMGNLINENKCKTLIVNGVEDHVHCLVGLKPSISVSDLMKVVKSKSSKYINDHSLTKSRFEWQVGFGVFSYSQRELNTLYNYVQNQEEHHKKQSFKDEYTGLLKEFNIEYNHDYIFHEPL